MFQATEFRFGLGPHPGLASPDAPERQLTGPDLMLERFPGPPLMALYAVVDELRQSRVAQPHDPARNALADEHLTAAIVQGQKRLLARALDTLTPYRERLARFWANHFAINPRQRIWQPESFERIDSQIRPHLAGRFTDMLRGVTLHPSMIRYLDQDSNVGPNSPGGRYSGVGLNENLGRELLELHTLGVGAGYVQADVTATARLLSGHFIRDGAPHFEPDRAEPGMQTIMGRRYGSLIRRETDLDALLEDLACHPSTAAHLTRKLAVHFVNDDPSEELLEDLADCWLESRGDLGRVSALLASHPAALEAPATKIRQPDEFLIAALRALGLTGGEVMGMHREAFHGLWFEPLNRMGRPFEGPPAADGWPERGAAWINAPMLAARIDWAMDFPARLRPDLPDARQFIETALGPRADMRLRRLVAAAETNAEGLGLTLAAPAFQRR